MTTQKNPQMKNNKKTFMKTTAILLAAVLAVCAALPNAAYAVTADPDTLKIPGIYSAADDGVAALKKQLASMEKMLSLNVKQAEKIPVLLYHHLVNENEMTDDQRNNDSIMTVEQFSAQMQYLYDSNYYTASLSELEQYISGRLFLPERTVVITFDDGYRSNTRYAYPILKKYGFQAAIFIITSTIGGKGNIIERAGWPDLKRCGDVFSYNSHSHNLHTLGRDGRGNFITSSSDTVRDDLLVSKALLSTSYLAYPYGQTSRAALRAAADAGFRMGFTTAPEYVKRKIDTLEIPRFNITPNTSMEAFELICNGGAATAGAAGVTADAAGNETGAAAGTADVMAETEAGG